MTISEIIDGLEEIQHQKLKHTNERDIQRVCELTIQLARQVEDLQSSLRTHATFGDHGGGRNY